MSPELRKDYCLDRYVIIAKERNMRPQEFKHAESPKGKDKKCYFCPGNEKTTPPEISRVTGENGNWKIRVFPNKFPAAKHHEVIVETPVHGTEISTLPAKHLAEVFRVFSERIKKLEKEKEIRYVLVFKNFGGAAGASLEHTHSQLVALPMIPPQVEEELAANRKSGTCIRCKEIKKEKRAKKRVIYEDAHTMAFCPYASRFPFEVCITPKKHVRFLEELGEYELLSFAIALKKILSKMQEMLKNPPYNFYLHVSPSGKDMHLHLTLFPRLTKLAGFEFGSGVIINVMAPEDSAVYYRGADKKRDKKRQ